MPKPDDVQTWTQTIHERYTNYLKTSFFFRETSLRKSFELALEEEGSLLKGPYPEAGRGFAHGLHAHAVARECFSKEGKELLPALIDQPLYEHQEKALRNVHVDGRNIVVATGTASGKTEAFLYPIFFELYRQYLAGKLQDPGVRAMILYPMNALANDQRERLGEICASLRDTESNFAPTFGQYIGQTPNDLQDHFRNATTKRDARLPGEMVFRDEMRKTPPHILLTNYSMLEYLLIRPDDSPLFDSGRGEHWQFIVLDEAHQYRGSRGMEMGMLIRRLKQRLREGGRTGPFRCIATSATMSSHETSKDRQVVAEFAKELFGEPFSLASVIFGKRTVAERAKTPRRYHLFLRALEGAFLVHQNGTDAVVLNRKGTTDGEMRAVPLEIALCRECGQHYYVGQDIGGRLKEAVRDPSRPDFGVEYYLPTNEGHTHIFCRQCGSLGSKLVACRCQATIWVKKCKTHSSRPDQLSACETCGYQRGGIGDPVQEVVHGTDGPNAVIATALQELLPEASRKVLAFADSRQEAAFFAWYIEDTYEKVRDRNLLLRAMRQAQVGVEGLSLDDLKNRLFREWNSVDLFGPTETVEGKDRHLLKTIFREALTDERRLCLEGVGLLKWFVKIPDAIEVPEAMMAAPWNLTSEEARKLLAYLLDTLRQRSAMALPSVPSAPNWGDIFSQRSHVSYSRSRPRSQSSSVREWGSRQSQTVKHFLVQLLKDGEFKEEEKILSSVKLMKDVWNAVRCYDENSKLTDDQVLIPAERSGTFRLNPRWLRVKIVESGDIWACSTCGTTSGHNIRNVCGRSGCPGNLSTIDDANLKENHYRTLYESSSLPSVMRAEEHTAQIESEEARKRQDQFKNGKTHLLSSSTTFEVGVDLGDLEAVFLRNVPPEPFSYTQRVGRAGRRDVPGLALTYCRRNPHDLYHFEDPEKRVLEGQVRPPRLQMTNERIILRHAVATVLSAFFRVPKNLGRFKALKSFVGDWANGRAASDLVLFCENNDVIADTLRNIVPDNMHSQVGLSDNTWADRIAGPASKLAISEEELCSDHSELEALIGACVLERNYGKADRIQKYRKTIEEERPLNFLSRKAIIPKYGFPVDVVELQARTQDGASHGVLLQRDLSQAIAEYAPGGTVVANKLEWKSSGIKIVPERALQVCYYQYDEARNFEQRSEAQVSEIEKRRFRKYLIPRFGFVTPLLDRPKEPRNRTRRLYTTRPFFRGFSEGIGPKVEKFFGVQVTQATPGVLVILCEGQNKGGFFVCLKCGAHMMRPTGEHKTPLGSTCQGTLGHYSLGHELPTDVVRLQFSGLCGESDAYSVAYAVLLGAAESLDVPATDLNVTVTGGAGGVRSGEAAIVIYDDVPGGAGLVAQLGQESVFGETLRNAWNRVRGECGCDTSCYGCLRSYRNQFAHTFLDRTKAEEFLAASDIREG